MFGFTIFQNDSTLKGTGGQAWSWGPENIWPRRFLRPLPNLLLLFPSKAKLVAQNRSLKIPHFPWIRGRSELQAPISAISAISNSQWQPRSESTDLAVLAAAWSALRVGDVVFRTRFESRFDAVDGEAGRFLMQLSTNDSWIPLIDSGYHGLLYYIFSSYHSRIPTCSSLNNLGRVYWHVFTHHWGMLPSFAAKDLSFLLIHSRSCSFKTHFFQWNHPFFSTERINFTDLLTFHVVTQRVWFPVGMSPSWSHCQRHQAWCSRRSAIKISWAPNWMWWASWICPSVATSVKPPGCHPLWKPPGKHSELENHHLL